MNAPAPPPIDIKIGEVISAALAADLADYQREQDLTARFHSAQHLARLLVPILGVTEVEAWDELIHVPDNLLHLLDSPQGWATLSGMIAHDLGVYAPTYVPAIH